MERLMLLMVLIWTLNTAFSLLSKYFGLRVDPTRLFCGITAYCGNKPANPDWIKMIMMYNQERGEDSTGWAVNNKIVKDNEKVTKFIQANPLIVTPEDENFTIVGHARKSSSGPRNKELAHPFGIYEDDTEKEVYDLILAMNGTLTNTELLSKKWGIDFKYGTNSDTQMLAKAMVKLGSGFIEALELYDGTATLAFFMPKYKNTLLIYKDPERPLYCWNQSKNQMYISSLQEPLLAIGADKKSVLAFRDGEFFEIEEGVIINNERVIRTPEKYPVFKNNSRMGFNKNRSHYHSDYEYDGYSAYEYPTQSVSVIPAKEKISLKARIEEKSYHDNKGGVIYTINERYFRNGHFVDGKFNITDRGKVKSDTKDAKTYFFTNGYMCKSEEDYNIVVKKSADENGVFNRDKFISIRLSDMIEHFQYPAIAIVDRQEKWLLNSEHSSKLKKINDKLIFTPFLSDEEFTLIYKDDCTKINRKVICNIGEITKKVTNEYHLSKDLMSEVSEIETVRFLTEKFKKEASDSPHYFNTLVRQELWRVQPSDVLKEYVFNLILRMAIYEDVINEKQLKEIKIEGAKNLYSGKDYINEMQSVIRNLQKKLKEKGNENIAIGKTTLEKIKIVEDNPEQFSQKDCIESIKSCNSYFLNDHFTDDIYHAKEDELDLLKNEWVAGNDKDLFEFYEGVLLCFNTIGKMSDQEFLYALEADSMDRLLKANEIYKKWHEYLSDCENCTIKQEEEPVKDVIVDEKLLEEKDEDYYENEYVSEVQEIVETMKDVYDRMEKVETALRTPRFMKVKVRLGALARDMEKYIMDDVDPGDKTEKNEQ